MQSFIRETLLPYDLATPHEINAEIGDIAGTIHTLDRDNLDGLLPASTAALGVWNVEVFETKTTTRSVVHAAGSTPNEVWPVPDEAGEPWLLDVVTGDGVLEIVGSIGFDMTAGPLFTMVWLAVRVDGVLYEAPAPLLHVAGGLEVDAVVPVAAGSHRVELVYLVGFTSAQTLNWLCGSLYVRGMNR